MLVRSHIITFPIGPLTPMMRSMVIAAHGHYGNTKTIDGARSRFDDHISGKAICDVNLRTAVSYNRDLPVSRVHIINSCLCVISSLQNWNFKPLCIKLIIRKLA